MSTTETRTAMSQLKAEVKAGSSSKLPANVVVHDMFNLAAILSLIGLTCNFMITGTGFVFLWWTTMVYFWVDGFWVVADPTCVKDPVAIISHHILTAIYLLIPLYYERYATLMAFNMLVEINTWLLIAKRHVKSPVLEALFYGTWVVMRLIVYPYLVLYYCQTYLAHAKELGTHFTIVMLAPLLQAYLSGLNIWWTAKMLQQMIVKRRKGGQAGGANISNGTEQERVLSDDDSSVSEPVLEGRRADLDVDVGPADGLVKRTRAASSQQL